ncbi:MAG: hypothetical protein V3R95_00845 [Dehalococcoidia bacterium]
MQRLATILVLLAVLLVACSDDVERDLDDAESSLRSMEADVGAARAALQAAQAAAQACDPDGAADAAEVLGTLVEQINASAAEGIASALDATGHSDQYDALAASFIASMETLAAEAAALVPPANEAVGLARQRLDDGECDSAIDDTSDGSTTGGGSGGGGSGSVEIPVLMIGGANFPAEQFHEANPDACDEYHYHGSPVFALDGTSISDPNPRGCGHGTTGELEVVVITVSQAEFDAYRAALVGD